jgi:hypothetical protein
MGRRQAEMKFSRGPDRGEEEEEEEEDGKEGKGDGHCGEWSLGSVPTPNDEIVIDSANWQRHIRQESSG